MREARGLFLLLIAILALGAAVTGQTPTPIEIQTAFRGESPEIRELARDFDWALFRQRILDHAMPNVTKGPAMPLPNPGISDPFDPMVQHSVKPKKGKKSTGIDLKQSFEGTSDADNVALLGFAVVPPDTNGDVGKKYFAQMNNLIFEIFDKKTGASVMGPLPNTFFWQGTGSVCELFNDGDPVVLYDHDAERWVFSQFAIFEFVPSAGVFVSHQCFAVSQTKDPTGAYYLYDFIYSVPTFGGFAALNDYPKIGVWPSGYFISVNEFEIGPPVQFVGASLGVVDRAAMLAGAPAGGVKFILPFTGAAPRHFSLQPSHWEGKKEPSTPTTNTFVQAFDDDTWGAGGGLDGYYLWDFTADFAGPTFSLTALGLTPSPPFDSNLCSFAECIPQPAPAVAADRLDTLSQFTMYRANFRNFGLKDDDSDKGKKHESIVVSHSVDADGLDQAGVRWAELRNRGSGYSVFQAGTYAPADGENRWMGSAAINKSGDIAIGYSVSSTTTFPSIRLAGRKKKDPLGVLGPELECHAGTGSQLGSANRWGD